jgi:hypothetical protein
MSPVLEMAKKAVTRCEICKTRIRRTLAVDSPMTSSGSSRGDEFRGVRCVP